MRKKREQRGDEVREVEAGGWEIKEPDYTGSYRPTEEFSFTLNKGGLRGF